MFILFYTLQNLWSFYFELWVLLMCGGLSLEIWGYSASHWKIATRVGRSIKWTSSATIFFFQPQPFKLKPLSGFVTNFVEGLGVMACSSNPNVSSSTNNPLQHVQAMIAAPVLIIHTTFTWKWGFGKSKFYCCWWANYCYNALRRLVETKSST
jgi:hypothetical protein